MFLLSETDSEANSYVIVERVGALEYGSSLGGGVVLAGKNAKKCGEGFNFLRNCVVTPTVADCVGAGR